MRGQLEGETAERSAPGRDREGRQTRHHSQELGVGELSVETSTSTESGLERPEKYEKTIKST